MHVYRMQKLFEATGKDRVVNIRSRASLYQTLDRLERHGLVEVAETVRVTAIPTASYTRPPTPAARSPATGCARCFTPPTATTPSSWPRCRSCSGCRPRRRRAELELRTRQLAAQLAETAGGAGRRSPGAARGCSCSRRSTAWRCSPPRCRWLRGVIDDLQAGRLTWSEEWLRQIAETVHHRRRPRGVLMTPMIEAHGLTKHYGKTQALDGLDLVAHTRPGGGRARPQRRRQDDVRAHGGHAAAPRRGHAARRRSRRRAATPRPSAGSSASPASSPPIEPAMTGRENLEMVARLFGLGRRDAKAAAASVLDQLGLERRRRPPGAHLLGRHAPAAGPRRQPGRAPRACCCSTSRPPALTRAAGSSCGTRSAPSSPAGTDVLLTTQYLDEADQLASEIVIIDHGRAVADGHARRAQAPGSAATWSRSMWPIETTSQGGRDARAAA